MAAPEFTAPAESRAPLRWRRAPRDGTNYCYWLADGWVIETKPRFNPACGYRLILSGGPAGAVIRFDRLREAKAAALWPHERLMTYCRAEFLTRLGMLAGPNPERQLEVMVEMARSEDADRAQADRATA